MVQVRNFLRRIDTGFLIAIAICLLAIWPFLSIPSLPQETDAELHIFRLAELSFLVRGGEFYPRWAPNFFHGYGYPIFNYYAPLAYYVGLIFELLPQIDPVGAVKIVFVMGILMGGIGVYGLVRDYWGRLAGYVAVALFVYAPYIQYIDPHARGVLAESFSFGVFPIALWTLDRLRRQQTAVRWITAVISVAAVILSHNLMALLFFGILCTWVVWQFIWTSNKEEMQSRKQLLLPGFSLICGLAVAAIFWLPVLLEQDAVNLNTLIGVGDNYDFHTHFLSLREMLSFSLRLDWGATEPLFRFNLGVGQWITALIAVVILILGKPTQQRQLWFFLISALFLIFLMLPQSAWIWENVPYLPFFQFPWRLLGATAVFLAILGGAGIAEIAKLVEQSKFKQIAPTIPAVVVVLVLLLALPLSQPMPWPDFGEVNVLRMSLIEHSGRWLGTTSTVDYVPITVDTLPKRVSGINKLYEGLPIDRVNWATTPEAASVEVEHITPLHFRYTISTPKDFTFRLFLFDFPGWEATLDGDPVEIQLGKPEGLITILMPTGDHLLELKFGSTPARSTAVIVTLVGLIMMVLLAVGVRRQRPPAPVAYAGLNHLDKWMVGAVVAVTAVSVFIIHPAGWIHDESTGIEVEPAKTQVFADFGGQITLLGHDSPNPTMQPGELFDVTVYWKLQQLQEINFQSYIHIIKPDGTLLTQSDHLNPGEFPTRRWPLDKYVRDTHFLQLPANTPPGEYDIVTGLWVQSEGWRLPLFDQSGSQIGDNFKLFTLTVTP